MIKMNQPLISIIVLSYKNYKYIYEALDSIRKQDYQNIEIIITNDGSDDFNEKEIKDYFSQNKTENIQNVIINNNKKNLGTVKSINNAIKISHGQYINFFAADDVMYDSSVIKKFVQSFDKISPNDYIVTSQLAMYDNNLKSLIKLFVSKKNIKLLKTATPLELFNQMSTECIIGAAGTCYKKTLFERFGYFDDKYKLVEDYSSALKFSRLGIKYNYFDFISFKHRDGGISHGNIGGEVKLNKQYDLDILNIMKREILPYLHLLDEKQKNKFIKIFNDHTWRFSYNYRFKKGSKKEKKKFVVENYKKILSGLNQELEQYLKDQLTGKKLKMFLLGSFIVMVSYINQNFALIELNFNENILKLIGIFMIIESLILTFYQLYKIFWLKIVDFIKVFI